MLHTTHARFWIEGLDLIAHPEGGYFRETYRSSGLIAPASLPSHMQGSRCYGTAIYYLLETGQVSRWHRIKSDELWFYHAGSPLDVIVVQVDGQETVLRLGLNLSQGERPQALVPAGSWFGARLAPGTHDYTLVSCTVSPGFDFQDFELATRAAAERCPSLLRYPELMPSN